MVRCSVYAPSILATLVVATLGSAALAGAALAACPSGALFGSSAFYTAGQYAASVASGDFNHDGILDLAVTNAIDNSVSVLLGQGDGTFLPQVAYPAGSLPRGIAAVDVNADGILDLVVTNVGTSTISILEGLGFGGHGNGTFGPLTSFTAGSENRGVVVIDLNHDGHPDIVAAGRTSVAVLLNQETAGNWGTFPSVTQYPTPSSWGVTAGDFDGDGIIDVAAGNWLDSRVDILLGNGDGTFRAGTPITTPGGGSDITSGDLNADGAPDLVASGSSGVWVMMGHAVSAHGDGTFAVAAFAQFGHQFNSTILGDFNGDGLPDILGTDTDGSRVVFLPGDGAGGFGAPAFYPVGTGPIGLVAFDANSDMASDVFVACSASQGYPGAIAALIGLCEAPAPPHITFVKDVPNDQGGKVFVFWHRSPRDNPIDHKITSYRVWRRDLVPGTAARVAPDLATFDPSLHTVVARPITAPNGNTDVTYWELMTVLPAAYLDGYASTAPTVQDSVGGSNPYTAFFVQALTADPFTFYNSPVDSGYSLDNIAPREPDEFAGQFATGTMRLHWNSNRETDLAGYRIYRGSSSDFTPGSGNLVATTPDTSFMDSAPVPLYYRLSA